MESVGQGRLAQCLVLLEGGWVGCGQGVLVFNGQKSGRVCYDTSAEVADGGRQRKQAAHHF